MNGKGKRVQPFEKWVLEPRSCPSCMDNPTTRFTNRVDNYVKYRPSYPLETLQVLKRECGFTEDATVADVGSGTGIFSRVLLDHGNSVFAVEPNVAMRAAAERLLAPYPRFTSVDGTAESTTLPADSVRFITVAQALHWFDPQPTRTEFARILQPGGWVTVFWNERLLEATPFQRDYENLLQTFGTDYAQVRHSNLDVARVRSFFGSDKVKLTVLRNRQEFDFTGLKGRLLSSSYAPDEMHPNHAPMLTRVAAIFEQHQANGQIFFDYDLNVYAGQFGRD